MKRSMVVAALLCAIAGCDSKTDAPKKAKSAGEGQNAAPAVPELKGNAAVRGKITFAGTPPVMKEMASAHCDTPNAKPVMEETVIVGTGNGLKNVLVSLEGVGPGVPKGQAPVLDQVNCTYTPHVMGVVVGQDVTIRSSDPTFHNVHILGSKGDVTNFSLTTAGQEKKMKFDYVDMLRAKCDVHPWMLSYVGVFENPFFAVTSEDGGFEIKGVPAGSYTLVAWHEQYGRLEKPVTLADDKPVEGSMTYKAN
jgi:hypothetical protein